jgi:Tfp pilus assembly protein PilX
MFHDGAECERDDGVSAVNERMKWMERAKDFRASRERAGEMALASANAAVREAEQKLAQARAAETIVATEAMKAMERGDRAGRAMSSGLRKAFGLDREHRQMVTFETMEVARDAEEALKVRRLESEQAVTLHKQARQVVMEDAAKKEQAEMVERFLARSRWSSAKIRVKSLSEPSIL